MAYPQLGLKIEVLQKKYKLDMRAIGEAIKKDKSTAWRWLQRAGKLSLVQQDQLVNAICQSIVREGTNWTADTFRGNDVLAFCLDVGCSKLEAAMYSGLNISVPDIFLDWLFRPDTNPNRFVGHYRLFRHDKDKTRPESPFLQAFASIKNENNHKLVYEDHWAGDSSDWSYEGFVFPTGNVTNIVGQRKTNEFHSVPEMFWCGLHGKTDTSGSGRASGFHGYVSDFTRQGRLFADRIVLVRVPEEEWHVGQRSNEYFVKRERCAECVGDENVKFLEAWTDVPV